MNNRETDVRAACGQWHDKRKDWVGADIVERGIEMHTDHGYEQAVKYLMKYDIPIDVIERVLLNRQERRVQSSGAL